MTNYEKIKGMSVDDLAAWLSENSLIDTAPWVKWFDANYCNKCPAEKVFSKFTQCEEDCSWCELNHKCRFFQELADVPDNQAVIKLWLNEETADDEVII